MGSVTTEKSGNQAVPGGPSGWPGGWYVYENGKVDGPYSAEQAFRMDADASDGKPRLVSRKGFSQWYALKDLSEIFRMTEQLGRKVGEHGKMSEAQLMAQAAALRAPIAPSPKPSVRPKVQAKKVETVRAKTLVEAPIAVAASVATARAPEPPPASAAPAAAPEAPATTPVKNPKQLLMREYFLARGRLRLGKLRNPWLSGVIGLPLSLGAFWYVWVRDLAREVAFHARAEKSDIPPVGLALVPGAHIYVIHKLAQRVAEMEAQNKYTSVRPAIAALLAFCPPLAVIYLQNAANRHWLLHAKHSSIKKPPETAPAV
jgi:hypothetical protein